MRCVDQVVGARRPGRGRTFAGTDFQGTAADRFDHEPCHRAVHIDFVSFGHKVGKADGR